MNRQRRPGFSTFRHVLLPLALLSCFGLGIFWLYSLFLLVTDYHPFGGNGSASSMVEAGTDLLSYTVTTREEYVAQITGLKYDHTTHPDDRFEYLKDAQHGLLKRMNDPDKRIGLTDDGTPPTEKIITHYPTYFTFQQLVTAWPLADTSAAGWERSPAHPHNGNHGLARFDYTDPTQRALALRFRQEELPFILENVPEIASAVKEHFSLESIKEHFGHEPRMVERSANNQFMYYTLGEGMGGCEIGSGVGWSAVIAHPFPPLPCHACHRIYLYHEYHF